MTTNDGRRRSRTWVPGTGLAVRLHEGWRDTTDHLPLALLWGLLMALSAYVALWLHGRDASFHTGAILALFFLGGALAFPFSVFLTAFLSYGRRAETRFSAAFLALTLLTILATAFLFAMEYRLFYARWHAPFATRIWAYQFAFTSASAVYQFIVMGIRLYVPCGLLALAAMSLYLASRGTLRR